MARIDNNLEGGTPPGNITAGSAGNSFTFVNPGSGTIQYDSTHPAHGSLSAKHSPSAGTPSYLQLGTGTADFNTGELSARYYLYRTDSPPSGQAPMMLVFANAAGTVRLASINFASDGSGKMYVRDQAGTILYTTPSIVALSAQIRIEMRAKIGAAGVGAIAAAWYPYDSTTADFSYSNTTTAVMGSTNFGGVMAGKFTTEAWATPWWIDDFSVDTAPTGAITNFIGPVSTSPASTVYPTSLISNSGLWVPTGAASIPAALADSSDSSYATNPGTASGETAEVSVGLLDTGNITVHGRAALHTGSSAGILTFQVKQGTSVIATFPVTVSSTTPADFSYTLSPSEMSAVTDRGSLRVAWSGN